MPSLSHNATELLGERESHDAVDVQLWTHETNVVARDVFVAPATIGWIRMRPRGWHPVAAIAAYLATIDQRPLGSGVAAPGAMTVREDSPVTG